VSEGGTAPINRQTLHDEVVERVRGMILEGQLAAGERVQERALSELLGISRTPLREAFKVLAREGLIRLKPNRGATVTRLTIGEAGEMFEVMAALEALAGELACVRIGEDEIAEIRALHYQMLAHHARGERPEYFRLNQDIHRLIAQTAGNETLAEMIAGLSDRLRSARYQANLSRERWDQAVAEHGEILAALEARDAVALAAVLRRHLRNKFEVVKATIEAAESETRKQA
jgi:DNA-binding GntR family transcriptional regulator